MASVNPSISNQRCPRSSAISANILVVDDHSSIVTLCQVVLEGVGCTVYGVKRIADALTICTQLETPIDMLLTDLVLPSPEFVLVQTINPLPCHNGYQLAVRAAMIRNGLRIVLMSGDPDEEFAGREINQGSLPLLAKPFGKDDLVGLIQEVLAQPAPILNRGGAGIDVAWFN